MDIKTFKAIIDEQDYESIKAQYGVQNKFMTQFPIRSATKESTDKTCSICCDKYKEYQKVFFLPCKHHFHVDCILPWFEKNHICPTCRFDLNQGEQGFDIGAESEQYGNPDLFKE